MFSASKTGAVSSGYKIANSLRFRSSANPYLNRTPASASNRTTFTWSGWVKKAKIATNLYVFGAEVGGSGSYLFFTNSDTLQFYDYASGSYQFQLQTTQVFRDPSAWYHIVVVFDTTQATSSNRIRMYVNGVQITAFGTATYPSQNYANSSINNNNIQYIGYTSSAIDGYLADINFIDGQALTPSSFGAFDAVTGVWTPARYAGTYGTNGFHLNFSNGTSTTTLGYDSSGNSNNWTTNNISLTVGSTYDWMIDSPTPYQGSSYGVGNYSVWNAVKLQGNSASNGNLRATLTAGGPPYLAGYGVRSTIAIPATGQWYCEITPVSSDTWSYVGIADINSGAVDVGNAGLYSVLYRANGDKSVNGTASSYGASYTTDTIGIAVDSGAGTVTFYKNNTSQGSISLPSSSTNYCFVVSNGNGQGISFDVTFGQRPFAYTPPTGFKALNTQNLPAVSIANGANHMAATLYAGTYSNQNIVNAYNSVSFQPDFIWIKNRSVGSTYHSQQDTVRGTLKMLESNATNAETTYTQTVTGVTSTGFTLGDNSDGYSVNQSGYNYVAWQWKAGGTAVTNTAGSITSQVSANPTAGFSVVTWTCNNTANQSIGHGLGVAPSLVIVKDRDQGAGFNWNVWFTGFTANEYLQLNTTIAKASYSTLWYTVPDSTKIYIGTAGTAVNNATDKMVAYCFAAIPGYSAFGSYTGNGSSDGPFVYCGFRPRYLMVKRTDSTGAWEIYDTSRSPYNVTGAKDLQADSASAEGASGISLGYDILSNGFKNRDTTTYLNASGGTYIYAAFAENPFQNALAR